VKSIEVDGGHVACWDSGTGPALVVVHGTGTPGELWKADLLQLTRSWRVITYDRRGYGRSSEPPGSWQAHRNDAARVVEQLGAAPATILGYGGGAIAAIDLAIQCPELVAALVLVDPALYGQRERPRGLRRVLMQVAVERRLRGETVAAETWIRYISSYQAGGSAWDKAVPARREAILASARGVLADLDAGDGSYIDERHLRELGMPVTIVDARQGPAVFRESVDRLSGLMSQARVVALENSSHIVMLDARAEMLDVLRDAMTARGPVSRAD
jgi:pimeloyl-ACP methyl ester carboxylesterase